LKKAYISFATAALLSPSLSLDLPLFKSIHYSFSFRSHDAPLYVYLYPSIYCRHTCGKIGKFLMRTVLNKTYSAVDCEPVSHPARKKKPKIKVFVQKWEANVREKDRKSGKW
jgi:hypothetical protein